MIPIYLNTTAKGYYLETFKEEFISICNQHRNENRALLFAFIIYDFQNPHISKVLNDRDYWLNLNETSGNYLTVFSLHHKHDNRRDFRFYPSLLNPSEIYNFLIQKYFSKEVKIKYPAIIFFQTNSERIIDHVLIELNEDRMESSFLEIRNYIEIAVRNLRLINEHYKTNYQEIFDRVKESVNSERGRIVSKRGLKKFKSIIDFVSSIVGLS